MDAFIAYLRNLPPDLGFNMNFSSPTPTSCGSACCLGGHACVFLGESQEALSITQALRVVSDFAMSTSQAYRLCFPPDDHWAWKATVEDAVATLEHFKLTGEAEWKRSSTI